MRRDETYSEVVYLQTTRTKPIFEQIPNILAVLIAERGSYTYIDKIGYSPSRDLTLFYIREALRAFHSLLNQDSWSNKKARELAMEEIEYNGVNSELEKIAGVSNLIELREIVSLITAKALSKAAELRQSVEQRAEKCGTMSGER